MDCTAHSVMRNPAPRRHTCFKGIKNMIFTPKTGQLSLTGIFINTAKIIRTKTLQSKILYPTVQICGSIHRTDICCLGAAIFQRITISFHWQMHRNMPRSESRRWTSSAASWTADIYSLWAMHATTCFLSTGTRQILRSWIWMIYLTAFILWFLISRHPMYLMKIQTRASSIGFLKRSLNT